METSKNIKYYNELDDEGRFEWPGKYSKRPAKQKPARTPIAIQQFVQTQDDSRKSFTYTYKAARFEESWLLASLGYFYEQHWISDVLRKIKAGKEASVYLCRSGEQVTAPLVAVKVYRPRMLRNLRNDSLYREGRIELDEEGHEVHDTHSLHAIITRSNFGEQVRHQSWIAYEYTTLQALYEAGADVPHPYEMAPNAILMGYLGDEAISAPTLNEVDLEPGEAGPLFERLRHNLDLMLATGRVHGDLSAYNVLYWGEEIALIDFPQVISPNTNRNAYAIFERDVTRLCEYFIRQGLSLNPRRIAADLWTAHGYRVQPEVHPGLLDADNPGDRKLWKQVEKAK
jgi:RIO kinase 1